MSARTLLVLAGVLAGGPALAAPRGAALLPSLKPPGAPEMRERFHEAVTRGLQQAGLEVIPAAEIRMRLGVSEEMMSCAGTGPCAARVGLLLRTDVLIAAEIGVSGKDYTIKLRALDAAGREVGHLDDSCDICTLKEADEAVVRATAKLASMPRAESAPTAPPPAYQPPPRVETPPPNTVEAPPPATSPPPPAPYAPAPARVDHASAFPLFLVLGISAGVVGIIGVSVGSYLVSIDGQPSCDAPDPIHRCPSLNNTVGGGGALIGLGLASLGGSAALLYLHFRSPKSRRPRAMVLPTPQGAVFTLSGSF